MITHELKCAIEPFEQKWQGKKDWEFRKNDRDFQIGDILLEKEYDTTKDTFTGREITEEVLWILKGGIFGIPEDCVIMSTKIVSKEGEAESISFETLFSKLDNLTSILLQQNNTTESSLFNLFLQELIKFRKKDEENVGPVTEAKAEIPAQDSAYFLKLHDFVKEVTTRRSWIEGFMLSGEFDQAQKHLVWIGNQVSDLFEKLEKIKQDEDCGCPDKTKK